MTAADAPRRQVRFWTANPSFSVSLAAPPPRRSRGLPVSKGSQTRPKSTLFAHPDSSSRYPLPRNSSYSTPSHRGSLTPSELALDTPLDPARFSRVYEDEFDFAPPSKERLAEARKNVDPW